MDQAPLILFGTAASIGFVHTLVGVDHSLPFVVLARSEKWSLKKLLAVTTACGIGHILGSLLIGTIGIGLGVALSELTWLEAFRGGLAARLLIGLGLAYMVWGMWRAMRAKRHAHAHAHDDGTIHVHEHDHLEEHAHLHAKTGKTLTLMGLFIVFILGPCEALIPMLMAPAFEQSWAVVVGVVAVFAATTLATMLALVTIGYFGLRWRGVAKLERHMHALAGFAIAISGLAIELLGI